jgi:hypothetical protein
MLRLRHPNNHVQLEQEIFEATRISNAEINHSASCGGRHPAFQGRAAEQHGGGLAKPQEWMLTPRFDQLKDWRLGEPRQSNPGQP